MFCQGINHFLLHVYIHQPWDDRVPGVTAWFGMSYQRNNTWFEQSKSWIDYIRRCHYLLQKGSPVTDLCYFIGEDAPKMTGILNPGLPAGYDYDFINAEVLNKAAIKDGCLTLPGGKQYHLLILPDLETMRPELFKKICQLITEGANVFGPPPKRSPSMAGYPECDNKISALSSEVWGSFNVTAGQKKYGKGNIFYGPGLNKVLDRLSLEPDVICSDTGILWTHRQTEDEDIYFLSNQHDYEVLSQISFRIKNKIPEFWDPDSGMIKEDAWFNNEGGRIAVPVRLDPSGSVFIIFRKSGNGKNIVNLNIFLKMKKI